MSTPAQTNAVKNYRQRLTQRGLGRFEVKGLLADRALIRALAQRLAEDNSEANKSLRMSLARCISPKPPQRGHILAALLSSPLAGTNLNFTREETSGRVVDL
jgi:hypothetical protein